MKATAWMHNGSGRYDIIHDEVKHLLESAGLDTAKNYEIPLYAHAEKQPLNTDEAVSLIKSATGDDAMQNGNLLKIFRAAERAHGIKI